MSGQLQTYNEVTEKNHERMNEFEDELISLRRMMERIGREKRSCMIERIDRYMAPIAAALVVLAISMGLIAGYLLLDKVG